MADQETDDISGVEGVASGGFDDIPDMVIRGVDPGGSAVQIAVGPGGTLISNLVAGEVIATVGTISQVDRIVDIQGGTIEQVQTPRQLTTATLAQNFEVTSAARGGDIPGTFDVGTFDSFTVMFQPQGAHGGTFTVEHQLRAGPGGPWTIDGVDGTISTDLVATIDHKGHQYRPALSQDTGAGSATLSVQGAGN